MAIFNIEREKMITWIDQGMQWKATLKMLKKY